MAVNGRPRIVIVGAGFAGLWAARTIARYPVEVLFLDRNNYHVFLPLLYQVAAAELEPEAIVYPVRSILRKLLNIHFIMANVERIDLDARTIERDGRITPYDYLILATGSTSHFFGVPGAAEYAFPLKTMEEAMALRNQILCRFEWAAHERDPQLRQRAITFVIVGGGPTGVEFASALAELIRSPLKRDYPSKDYPTLDFRQVRVILVEATNSLLSGMPEGLRRHALTRLQKLGVEVRLGATVSEVTRDDVLLKDGTVIPTDTVIWTAGVSGDPKAPTWGLPVARGGRIPVLPTLQVPGHPEVYVAGDTAYLEQDGSPLPMVAPVATQEGVAVARNIARQINGQEPLPFRYRDPGTMVTLGRNSAVAHVRGRSFTGFPAWLLWLGVHLFNLIGFRNRLLVMMNWAWDYIYSERPIRLILPSGGEPAFERVRCGLAPAGSTAGDPADEPSDRE